MTGKEIVKIIDERLDEMGISQKDFCAEIGISSAAMSAWRNGSMPKPERIKEIERALKIRFSDYENAEDSESAEVLQWLREDFSHRALFESAKGLTKEQAYAAASFIEKLKAGDT